MRFGVHARKQQAAFRKTLSTAADHPAYDKGGRHGHLIALGHEDENLMPELRGSNGARKFFSDRKIKWWRNPRSGDSAGDGPTRNLASSQVSCVNFLLSLASEPAALTELLRVIDPDVQEVLPIVHCDRSSLVEFEWVGWNGPLEGGATTRGMNQTSADALMVARTKRGICAYVIEWKYCEEYLRPEDKGQGASGDTRRRRYSQLFADPTSAFNDAAPLDEFFFEPHYQIMRLLLLADRIRSSGVTECLRVDDARVLVVCPEANSDYRNVVQSTPLARRFPQVATIEAMVRATLKDPERFSVVAQESLVSALRASPIARTIGSWLDYHHVRYGW